MGKLIDLNECAKIMGCKRTQLSGSVIRILEGFPPAEIPGVRGQVALFNEKKIIAWSKKHNCEIEVKKAFNQIYKQKKIRFDSEIPKKIAILDQKYCAMFLSGKFDPLEKRIEHETKKYNALKNSPMTQLVHIKGSY